MTPGSQGLPADRPWLVNVMAQSIDGRIAQGNESSAARRKAFLDHPEDLRILRETVAQCDAVIVGARTILSERGALRIADARTPKEPTWVVCSASGSLDFSHPFWQQEGISKMLCTLLEPADPAAGANAIVVNTELPSGVLPHVVGRLPEVLAWMRHKCGWKRVALLGGGVLNGLFWRARVVDELRLTIAPTLIPSDAAPSIVQGASASPIPLELIECRSDAGFLFLRYVPRTLRPLVALFCMAKCMFALNTHARAAGLGVGAYSLWTRGTVKSIALSGATVASTDNSAAVLENPAGIGQQPGLFRWAFDFGSPRDVSVVQPEADSFRERYLIVGGAILLWDRIGVGVGAEGQTYETSGSPDANTQFQYEDVLIDGHASLAIKLGQNVSLSGTYVQNLSRRAVETKAGVFVESTSTILSGSQFRYGFLWRITPKFSLGATHTRPSVLRSASGSTDGVFGFAYKPEHHRLGISWDFKPGSRDVDGFFPDDAKLFAQIDALRFAGVPGGSGLYYAPGLAFPDPERYRLEDKNRWIPRFAGETTLFRYEPVALRFWSGTYLEPAYLRGQRSRAHVTAGAHLKISLIVLQAAVDFARDFRNRNYGASVELGF